MTEIFAEFTFEAAHRLPGVPPSHRCARMHGHSYRVRVVVRGEPSPREGWVLDFADIEAACAPVREALDHRVLNEVPGLENPTSELLAHWLWQRLKPALPGLAELVVQETPTTGCVYRGETVST